METILPMTVYRVECVQKHEKGSYHTAIDPKELRVFCPHCGSAMVLTKPGQLHT